MENQPGQLVITLNPGERPMRIMGALHALLANQEEGNINFGVRESADGEVSDLPAQGVPGNAPVLRKILEKFEGRAMIEYASAELKRGSRKQASDIQPMQSIEDLEALKSSLRKELEKYLNDAASVMSRSVEMTP